MIRYILRNMWRRKARTFLTVFGIVVGIIALTVLGGLSARLTQQVEGARAWFTSAITVLPAGGNLFGGGGRFLEIQKASDISRVEGVGPVSASIGELLGDSTEFSFGAPDLVIGLELPEGGPMLENLALASGRRIEPGDSGRVLLGSVLAEKYNVEVGDKLDLKGSPFEVVGVLEPTLSAPDTFAFVEYGDALALFLASNPFIQNRRIAGTFYVIPEEGVDPEILSARIEEEVEGVRVVSPARAEEQIAQISLIFNAILFGIAFIALVVGGLSIINTMVMSVSERTREIGLKKAIGAGTRSILGEYLLESSIIGFTGGIIGMGLGVLIIFFFNSTTRSSQVSVFTVNWLVVAGPVIFATVLGTIAGAFPAFRAARLKPVDSLKGD